MTMNDTTIVQQLREAGFDVFPVGPRKVEVNSPLMGVAVYPSAEACAASLYGAEWPVLLGAEASDCLDHHGPAVGLSDWSLADA